jgi:hypothetical protein
MPRACTICTHAEQAAIEAAIVARTPLRDIARQFSVSKDAVARHASDHIREEIQQSQAAQTEVRGLDVVTQLKAMNETALGILAEALDMVEPKRGEKNPQLALQAMDRVHKQLEFQAKLLGDIDKPTVNIFITVEWRSIRATIVQALMPYHDARVAVAAALAEMEAGHARLN